MRFHKKLLKICVITVITLISTHSVLAGYSRTKAATYADKYWNKRNYAYNYYKGNNCANYVSQCLKAGGLSLGKGPGLDSKGCIPYCDNLHKHLIRHQNVTHKRLYSGYPSSFTKGDVVQFGKSSDRWMHAAINVVTGAPRLNANTNNRYHKKVSYFYPNYFKSADFYHINTSVSRPSNDNCSGARKLTVNGSAITGTVKNATKSYGPNKCGGCSCTSADDYDVYYYFKATSKTHTVILSNYASNFDGVIELRSACGYNKNISCYDPKGVPSKISKTWYNLTVGKKYYVRVFEYDYKKTPPKSPTFKIRVKSGKASSAANTAIQEDIYLTQQSISKTAVIAGEKVEAVVDQNYTGSSNSEAKVYLHYYLSADNKFDASDVLLSDNSYSLLSKSTPTETENESLTIPSETKSGTYYILFVGDATNVVKESNENNGVESMKITVLDNKNNDASEDISISNTSVVPEEVIAGGIIKVSAAQNYSGTRLNSVLPDIKLNYYLSTDNQLSSDDKSLGESVSGIGSDNPTKQESASVNVPVETAPGQYYIIFAADNGNKLNESDEDNNTFSYLITVTEESESNDDGAENNNDDSQTETTEINTVEVDNSSLMENISVYPNPVNDILNVELHSDINIKQVIITNHLGKQAMIIESLNNEQINVSDLSEGIYFIKFISDKNEVATYRVVKY
jgi:hypothetical protein